eukprot:213604-Chlamydomonas_euryale.AAC.36
MWQMRDSCMGMHACIHLTQQQHSSGIQLQLECKDLVHPLQARPAVCEAAASGALNAEAAAVSSRDRCTSSSTSSNAQVRVIGTDSAWMTSFSCSSSSINNRNRNRNDDNNSGTTATTATVRSSSSSMDQGPQKRCVRRRYQKQVLGSPKSFINIVSASSLTWACLLQQQFSVASPPHHDPQQGSAAKHKRSGTAGLSQHPPGRCKSVPLHCQDETTQVAASRALLDAKSEQQLSEVLQDVLFLDRLHSHLSTILGRDPSLQEWANAAGMKQGCVLMCVCRPGCLGLSPHS